MKYEQVSGSEDEVAETLTEEGFSGSSAAAGSSSENSASEEKRQADLSRVRKSLGIGGFFAAAAATAAASWYGAEAVHEKFGDGPKGKEKPVPSKLEGIQDYRGYAEREMEKIIKKYIPLSSDSDAVSSEKLFRVSEEEKNSEHKLALIGDLRDAIKFQDAKGDGVKATEDISKLLDSWEKEIRSVSINTPPPPRHRH